MRSTGQGYKLPGIERLARAQMPLFDDIEGVTAGGKLILIELKRYANTVRRLFDLDAAA